MSEKMQQVEKETQNVLTLVYVQEIHIEKVINKQNDHSETLPNWKQTLDHNKYLFRLLGLKGDGIAANMFIRTTGCFNIKE